MDKKGFTLIEVLVVVGILAILIIIAVPNIGGAFNSAKNKISDLEKKNLSDASETIVMEVINCEIPLSDFNYLFSSSYTACSQMQSALIGNTVSTTVAKLVDKDYFTDTSSKCSGTLSITTDASSYKVSVDTSEVNCSE